MRARTASHTPDPSSITYQCGRVSIRLLGGDGLWFQETVDRLIAALPDTPTRQIEATNGALACITYVLWDDPVLEWDASYSPDAVLLARGADLVEIARTLRAELWGPGARRLGLDLHAIGRAIPYAGWGQPVPGEAEAPTQDT